MKNPKDIIEDILRASNGDHDLTDAAHVGYSPKPKDAVHIQDGSNALENVDDTECTSLDDMGNYQPCQEIDFEVSEVKEIFEKKKKRRNYIEFRAGRVRAG